MQIPQVITLFGQQTQVYTLVIGAAICLVILLALAGAARGSRRTTFDMCLAGLAVGIVLARAEHVLLRWDYYAEHLDQALDVQRGGLGWHGAVLGAWLGMAIYQRIRRGARYYAPTSISHLPWGMLALALPILAAAAWVGCAAAGCAYGAEVRTLADFPSGVTAELRDVYGIVAPRWNTPLYGVVLAGVVLGGVGTSISFSNRTRHASPLRAGDDTASPLRRTTHREPRTFFVALAVFSFGMLAIGYARADAVVMVGGVRADQVLDAATLIVALTAWVNNARTP